MSLASTFKIDLERSLANLPNNEWAVVQARERAVQGISPTSAFESIVGILTLASTQTNTYAFGSCCQLAVDLAKLSQTTELPKGLQAIISELIPLSQNLGCSNDLMEIIQWYRLATCHESQSN